MQFIARHRRTTWAAVVALLLLALWMFWPDRRLDQVRAMQKELFSPEAKKLSPDERKSKFQALRQATENLSPAQKQELTKAGQDRFEKEMLRYAKMSKQEQVLYLDKQIDNMNKAKKGPAAGGQRQSSGGAGFAKKNSKPMSSEERDRMRRQRLDHSTPEMRAMMDRFRKDMQARMNTRGIQAAPWPRGGRGI